MNALIAVCLVTATLSVAVSAVYLIITLAQMRRTAEEAESLLSFLNVEARKVGNLGNTLAAAVSSVASSAVFLKFPAIVKLAAGAFGALTALIFGRGKKSRTCRSGETDDGGKDAK